MVCDQLVPTLSCRLVWALYCIFTTLHLYSNYQAVAVVCMETVNMKRFHLIMEHLFSSGQLPFPPWVNKQEPVLSGMLYMHCLEGSIISQVFKSCNFAS